MFDCRDKLTIITISKVYQTLYQINEQRILFLLMKKPKLSDIYLRKVLHLYYDTGGCLAITYSVWGENDFLFSTFSSYNRERGGGTEVVPLDPALLD